MTTDQTPESLNNLLLHFSCFLWTYAHEKDIILFVTLKLKYNEYFEDGQIDGLDDDIFLGGKFVTEAIKEILLFLQEIYKNFDSIETFMKLADNRNLQKKK